MSNNKSKVTAVIMAARLSSRCWDGAVHPCLGIRESPQRRSPVLVRESREEGTRERMQMSRSGQPMGEQLQAPAGPVSPSVLGISTQPPSGQRLAGLPAPVDHL